MPTGHLQIILLLISLKTVEKLFVWAEKKASIENNGNVEANWLQ